MRISVPLVRKGTQGINTLLCAVKLQMLFMTWQKKRTSSVRGLLILSLADYSIRQSKSELSL